MKRLLTAFAVFNIVIISCKKKDVTPPSMPVVTTASLTNVNIGSGSATAGGSIVSDGGSAITKSGVVWSKTNNTPTTTDSVVAATATTGAFTVNLTGLDFGNTYYFRAFATNSIGTGYGDVVTLTTSSDSVKFTYNGQSVTYGIITSPTTGKKWLDRNLGAKRQAAAFDDYQAYGDFFQWGRPADGHQLINWTSSTAGTPVNGSTTTLATSDMPGHSNFIFANDSDPNTKYDWRTDNNSNRWKTTPQGPCPTGWHVPTRDEWRAEVPTTKGGTSTSGGMIDRNTAYSLLKLVHAGYREGYGSDAGKIFRTGADSFFWSSTDIILFGGYTAARTFSHGINYVDPGSKQDMALGLSVRCIKD